MLKLEYIELLRLIPEALIYVFSGYALSKMVINWKKYMLSSLILVISVYLIRLLPIHYGVHSILILIILIILLVSINKIDVVRAVSAATITFILGFTTEGISIFLLSNVLKLDVVAIFTDPLLKTIYGMPSLVLLGTIIGCCYAILLKSNKPKKASHDSLKKEI